ISKNNFKESIGYSCDLLSRSFKDLCPSHHLHELRHTFITRCQECGVPREVVSVWAGHSADNTMTSNVYTHFSDEFMLVEAQKIDYYNRFSE
ncbi:MAG: tyrosine-type recombinase/integrase, partial [Clostridia bacterium]|nr:tyrosine-type recombinase/integrase [Clostridia bacterium]